MLQKCVLSCSALALLLGSFSFTTLESVAAEKAAKSKSSSKKASTNKNKMKWHYDFESGLKAAKKSKKMIFVDVGSEF